jgi:hypothetical protein
VVSTYRTAPAVAPPTVVVYRTLARWQRLLTTAILLVNFAGGAFVAALAATRVTIDCSRALGTCIVTKTYPVYGAVKASIPIASIEGTVLVPTHDDSNGDLYSLVFKTADGSISLESPADVAATRTQQKKAFDTFLAQDAIPSLHLDYDTPNPVFIFFLLWAIFPVFVLFGIWQRAVVRFDWATKTVLVERSFWPLWNPSRSYPLDHVTGAVIDQKAAVGGGNDYWLVLTHSSGERIRLLPGSSRRFADHVVAAEELRTAIRQKDGALRGDPPSMPGLPGVTRPA